MSTGISNSLRQRLLAAAFWLAALGVLLLSLLPVDAGDGPANADKMAHVLCFFVLAVLWQLAYPSPRVDWTGLAALAVFGLLIELLQYTLPWRSFSPADFLADVAGIVLGLVLRLALPGWRRA